MSRVPQLNTLRLHTCQRLYTYLPAQEPGVQYARPNGLQLRHANHLFIYV